MYQRRQLWTFEAPNDNKTHPGPVQSPNCLWRLCWDLLRELRRRPFGSYTFVHLKTTPRKLHDGKTVAIQFPCQVGAALDGSLAETGPFLAQSTSRPMGYLFKFTRHRSGVCGQHHRMPRFCKQLMSSLSGRMLCSLAIALWSVDLSLSATALPVLWFPIL